MRDLLCPWPKSVWPMTDKEYAKAIPDEKLRSAISGFLMRQGWQACLTQIAEMMNASLKEDT